MFNIVSIDAFNRVEQLYEYATEMEDCVPTIILSHFQELLDNVRGILVHMQEEHEGRARRSMLGRPALAIEEENFVFMWIMVLEWKTSP